MLQDLRGDVIIFNEEVVGILTKEGTENVGATFTIMKRCTKPTINRIPSREKRKRAFTDKK